VTSAKELSAPKPGPPRRGIGAGRAVALVVGSLLTLLAVAVLVAGGTAAWFANHRDTHGYMTGATATASTSTAALVSEPMTFAGMSGPGSDWVGDVRISVRSTDGTPVFVGVARASDAAAYLAGSAYDRVTVQGEEPYGRRHPWVRYHRMGGDLRSMPTPADQKFWAVSADGTGWQTVRWDPGDGDWVLVVANEDGSPGVHVTTDVRMQMPVFGWAAPVLLGVGVVVLGGGVLLIVIGARTRRADRAPVEQRAGSRGATR
jgi:hypothetical protein